MNHKDIILRAFALFAIAHAAGSQAYEYEMVVLTDTRDSSDLPNEVRSVRAADKDRAKIFERREIQRERHLNKLRRVMEDMDRDGYAIVEEHDLSTYDSFIAGTRELERAPYELAYVPIDLQQSAFTGGRLVGKQPLFEVEGRVHRMAYVFEFDDLGTILIDELDFTTIPYTRISVNKPTGNLAINGHPATYTALMGRDSGKGMSAITFITDSKLVTVTALQCITRHDKEKFERLVAIATAAYN